MVSLILGEIISLSAHNNRLVAAGSEESQERVSGLALMWGSEASLLYSIVLVQIDQ